MAGDASSMKSLVAYEKIRDMILAGTKLPGTRLVLSDLEKELGIGRGPIREALMRLDRSGLVRNIPYKGAVVGSQPTWDEINILFAVRMDLESRLMVEALPLLGERTITELEELHKRMSDLDTDFYQLDRAFHKIIYETANMPHVSTIVDKLIESVETFLTLYRQESSDRQRFVVEHGLILSAIKTGDPKLASEAMRNNIRSGLEVIERTFSLYGTRV